MEYELVIRLGRHLGEDGVEVENEIVVPDLFNANTALPLQLEVTRRPARREERRVGCVDLVAWAP